MKKFNKFMLVLAAAVFTFTACEKDIVRPDSPKFDGKAVFFPVSSESAEVEPTATLAHEIKIARDTNNTEALTVKLVVVKNTQDVFEVPESVSFAAGVTETSFLAKFPKAEVDSTYTLTIELETENSNPYLTLKPTYSFTVNIAKWDLVTNKTAIIFDGLVNAFYGTGNPGWYVSYARKNNADGSFDIRLLNPYTVLPKYKDGDYDQPIADEFGLYDGFPYNYPEDVDSEGTYNMTIHVSAKGACTFDAFAMGMTWSYGAFSAQYYDPTIPGVWDKAEKSITFPAQSSACFMADYGGRLTSEPIIVHLDDSLYKDIHSVISIAKLDDQFNDASIEWKPLAGDLKTFISEIQSDAWDLQLENAVDPNPKDKQGPSSDFYNLFRLKDVYAADYGLAFYWDTIKDKINLPDSLQPTGLEFASKDIYVGASAKNESFVETIDLKGNATKVFHFFLQVQTKDGGDLGEFEEVFYFGPDAIVWEKSDYIGNFILSGVSPFDGTDMAQKVVIKEEGDNLIMLGVARADTIVLTFDATTGSLAIEPQMLPGVFTYQGSDFPIVLATFDENFSIGFTKPLVFAFDLTGVAKLTATSPAIGYLVQAYGLGNLAGCYDLALTPASAKAPVAPAKVAEGKLQTATPRIFTTSNTKREWKVLGQLPKAKFNFKK